jgi:drug/metabolite transporter (DMT)-like permease
LNKNTNFWHYIHLHFIVLIWGFTGILGKLISLDTLQLVWYRLLIASVVLFFIVSIKKINLQRIYTKSYMLMGLVVAAHWLCFYGAIKVSNVSVALSAFSCTAFFTAFLEPIIFKRKISWREILPGILVIIGMYIIFNADIKNIWGVVLGMLAAFTASFFSTFNGLWAKRTPSIEITFFELLGALIGLTFFILLSPNALFPNFDISAHDWLWLLLLSIVCTVYPFVASIGLMRHFKPFVVSLTVNLEPIYTIILAILIFKNSEYMSTRFYIGSAITLISVSLYPFLKEKKN